jgi:hypothetical protein
LSARSRPVFAGSILIIPKETVVRRYAISAKQSSQPKRTIWVFYAQPVNVLYGNTNGKHQAAKTAFIAPVNQEIFFVSDIIILP